MTSQRLACTFLGGEEVTEVGLEKPAAALRLCAFIENSSESIFFLSRSGLVRYANATIRRCLGWKPQAITDTPFTDLLHSEDIQAVENVIRRCANPTGFVDQTLQIRLRAHQNSWRIFLARFSTVDEEHLGAGIAVNAQDITEKQALKDELQVALRNGGLAELVGSTTHDFNNYLMVIANSASMAEQLVSPESEVGLEIREIRKASNHAHKLIQKLLAKSRQSNGTFSIVDLNRLLVDNGTMLRRIASRPGSDITVQIDINPASVTCRGGREQLQQCLINLVSNAYDAIDEKGVIILWVETRTLKTKTVIGKKTLPAGEFALICVKDTGKGMTEDVANRIFDRFFSTKADTHGTGIGLATVKEIIDLHGGAIELNTAPGKGTEFRLFIPTCV